MPAQSNTNTECNGNFHPNRYSDVNPESYSYGYSYTYTYIHGNTESYAHSYANADSYAEIDSVAKAAAHAASAPEPVIGKSFVACATKLRSKKEEGRNIK